jgi:streptogramin lyase
VKIAYRGEHSVKGEISPMKISRKVVLLSSALLTAGIIAAQSPASAETLYGTSVEGQNIFSYDTVTNTVTTIVSLPGKSPDTMVFDSGGRIIYTSVYSGEVRRYDPASHADVLIASGLSNPADLLLDPGGNSILVSEYGGGRIDRINLTTFALSALCTTSCNYGPNPEGLAYDGSGRLFANLGAREGGATAKFVAELDPLTGQILHQSAGLNSLDGLTFDTVTGKLFAASLYGNGIYEIDPNTLLATTRMFGSIPNPDGITSDGAGNLFLAARGNFNIYRYNIAGNTLTGLTSVYGLDDLAPAAGLGAPIPEPETYAMLLAGLGLMGWVGKRRKQKAG